jgi:UDPglucose 6-dehydrogenase
MRIGFVGLGKLGKPCAEAMTERGIAVAGYDNNMSCISKLVDVKATLAEAVMEQDMVFVAVPTPHTEGYDGRQPTSHLPPADFDYSILKSVVKECNSLMNERQLLVIISTVLPGTIRRDIAPLANQTNLLYNPYLIAMGTVKQDFLDPEMIMIGTEQGQITWQASMLQNLYHLLLNKSVRFEFGTWEETEAMKIFYNTFISTKLSLVNMIQDVAQKLGYMNVDRVTTALANSTKRIMSSRYMKAGMGDGGACHPRDNIALRWLARELDLGYDLFAAVMTAREQQAENMAIEILKHGKNIFFSSDAYKSSTDLIDGSYSLLVQHYIKKHKGLIASQQNDSTEVLVRVHESDNIINNSNIKIFDPWRSYPPADNVIYYGKVN